MEEDGITNICYSGACHGADQLFGLYAECAGHQVQHFSFANHNWDKRCNPKTIVVLNSGYLMLADQPLKIAAKWLGRSTGSNLYVKNLLRRNFYQVKDSDSVFAITTIDPETGKPNGGTGWAIALAVQKKIPIYVFDENEGWLKFDHSSETWVRTIPPRPQGKYAGIGSREITKKGAEAIRKLYE